DYRVALAKRGRNGEAIQHLAEAVQLRPDFGDAWLNLGAAYAGVGRHPEAADCLRRGIQLEPDRPEARELLDRVHRELARARAPAPGR
ncbi:MAG: tetratricopeptide repeat protein, partial [Planctomycetota bacterium]